MVPEIFKAYDVRGKVGSELNPDVCRRIGQAFADWLPDAGPVAVGHDMRPDSPKLAAAAIEGLRAQGRSVWDIGLVATDMIYFAVGKNDLAGGVVVTASHNPSEYNGMKFCGAAARAVGLESGLAEIRDLAASGSFKPAEKQGELIPKNIDEAWIEHVLSFVDRSQLETPLKIAVDAGNGMMGKVFPTLEPHVPWHVSEMYFELDGTFPNHEANPLKFETLHDLIARVRDEHLDAGVAFDADGDRAFLVDETGEVITAGVISSMLSEYFLQKFPNSPIVYDARNSHAVIDVITERGGKPIKARVGHSFIKQVMRDADAPFGGEASGHFYFRDNWYADSGLIAIVIALALLGQKGGTLSELRKKYMRYEAIPETNFVIEDKEGMMRKIAGEMQDGIQDWFDGLTVTYNDGSWFNVRPSNTEPLLRLNAEARTKARLDELVAKIKSLLTSA